LLRRRAPLRRAAKTIREAPRLASIAKAPAQPYIERIRDLA
jgi:hypothetical protein